MNEDDCHHNIVIVGAGMAGLCCARELGQDRVVILEATNRIGGRLCAAKCDGALDGIDVGAEFVHGTGTMLTDLMDEFRQEGVWDTAHGDSDNSFWEEIFVTCHADGGPDNEPTKEGKYGMFYVNGKLVPYNDPSLMELNKALHEILDAPPECIRIQESVQDALLNRQPPLSPSLLALADASYGNTAGGPMSDLSLSIMARFERHWHENEVEGDFRIPATIGMHGVAQALANKLQKRPNLQIRLGCTVKTIREQPEKRQVLVQLVDGTEMWADAVVVTVPPPMYTELDMDLTASKLEALSFVGFERVIKVCIHFSCRFWPEKLQSVVCAHTLVPEFWFREDVTKKGVYIAVAYLTSTAADQFAEQIMDDSGKQSSQKAADLFMEQLAQVFDIPIQEVQKSCVDFLFADWKDFASIKGGYMYPRVGLTPAHLETLAAPMGRIYFAGEATNTNACCTIQAAIETGVRAARQVKRAFDRGYN